MSDEKLAGLYWVKEDIDGACQVYAIYIAATNHLVCTVDVDTPGAEALVSLFVAASDLLEACDEAIYHLDEWGPRSVRQAMQAAIDKARGE